MSACRILTGAHRVRIRFGNATGDGREAYNEVIDAINAGHRGGDCPVCTEVESTNVPISRLGET